MLKRILLLSLLVLPLLVVAFGCGGSGPKAYIVVENSASSTTNILIIMHEEESASTPITVNVNIPPGGSHQITAKPNCLYGVMVVWESTAFDVDVVTLTEDQVYTMTFIEPPL